MFENWGFLLGEIWVLLLIAVLLGLFAGWLIFGRNQNSYDAEETKAALERCQYNGRVKDSKISDLEEQLHALSSQNSAQMAMAAEESIEEPTEDKAVDYDGDGKIEYENEGSRPEALSAPREGAADDLKLIKGVGPTLEALCHSLGFYHFDQVANWTPDEIAWVDANLQGFKGRVSRDNWVQQAAILADGGETEFSKRAKKD